MSLDFSMVSGDNKRLRISVVNSKKKAVNIFGAMSVIWALFDSSGDEVLRKELGSGAAVLNDTTVEGQVVIDLAQIDTESLEGVYTVELQIIDSVGNKMTLRSDPSIEKSNVIIRKDKIL